MKLKTLQNTPPWEWPEAAGRFLEGILRDDRAAEADRLVAADLAGDITVIDDELADALLATARDDRRSAEVRSRAAISLGPLLEHADVEGFDDPDDSPVSERTVERVKQSLRELYTSADAPTELRRRALEAAVRAPQPWQGEAVRAAYASDDAAWRLTGAFCMRFVPGFEEQILEALESDDREVRREAVAAAGNWELGAAWRHVTAIVSSPNAEKGLLLAAIEAVASIRPGEAEEVLHELAESDDEDIAAAVDEAVMMAQAVSGARGEDDDGEEDEEGAEDDA